MLWAESPHDNSRVCFNEQAPTEGTHTCVNEPGFMLGGQHENISPPKNLQSHSKLLIRLNVISLHLKLFIMLHICSYIFLIVLICICVETPSGGITGMLAFEDHLNAQKPI